MRKLVLTLMLLLSPTAALAGSAHGSSGITGGVYASETGRIMIAPSTDKRVFGGGNPQIQVLQDTDQPVFSLYSFNGAAAPAINLGVSSGLLRSYGLPSVCCGGLYWKADDGAAQKNVAQISAALAATATSGSIPTQLLFYTTSIDATSATLKGKLDTYGRLILNSTGNIPAIAGYYPRLYTTTDTGASIGSVRYTDDTYGAMVVLGKSRSNIDGTNTQITSGDELGRFVFAGADGTTIPAGAMIKAVSTGTIGTNQIPAQIIMQTATSGGTLANAIKIDADQSVTLYAPIISKGYTVATLPAGVTGARAHVTDAVACTFMGALTGGGAVVCPVFYNGSAWVGG